MKASTAWIGASAAVLAGAALVSYNRKSWPFAQNNAAAAPAGSPAPVDVALTNEVASYTEHNPNNAADFTDDGATGNAD